MTPPPTDLNHWSKNALVREVQRLRALLAEHTLRHGSDPREHSADDPIIDLAQDPYAQGGALVDTRAAVLLDGVNVALVDTKTDEPVAMMLSLRGRVNMSPDRVEHAYLFGPDGAAGVVSEIIGLATRAAGLPSTPGDRFATEFQDDLERRFRELP